MLDGSHDSENNSNMAQTKPTLETRRSMRNVKPVFGIRNHKHRGGPKNDDSSGSEPEETPSKKQQQKKVIEMIDISSSSDSDSDGDIPAVKTPQKASRGIAVVIPSSGSIPRHVSISDTSEDEGVNSRPNPNTARGRGRASGGMFSSPSSAKKQAVQDEDEDELGFTLPPPRPNKARRGGFRSSIFSSSSGLRSSPKSSKVPDVQDDDSDPIISSPKRSQRPVYQDDDDSEEEIRPSTQRRPLLITTQNLENEDDEDVDVVSPLKRRRIPSESEDSEDIVSPVKRQRKVRAELDTNSDSDLPTTSRSRRTESKSETPTRFTRQVRARRHRTEKEKTLELLRRRRAGEDIEALTETSESGTDEDDDQDFEHLSEFEDEEEEEAPKPAQKTKETSSGDADEDFIVEDDEDDPLGIPSIHSIPLEFTHQAHKPLKEHFKDTVEWMIHNKVNPAFARDDPVYRQAFLKLEDECSALAKSKFSSTQWTRDFTAALYARPEFITGPLVDGEGYDPVTGQPKCDACNHRSHVPSFFIQFGGKAYDKKTLEELDQGSDYEEDDDDDGSSARSVNDQGQAIPREKTKWFVGRYVVLCSKS